MKDKYRDLIDNYLRGRLTNEQYREVERLMGADEDFRTELEFQQEVRAAFAIQQYDRLKERLKSLSAETSEGLHLHSVKKQLGKSFWYAAAVLLICSVGIYLWSWNQQVSRADLYLAYFEPYPNVVLPLTRDEAGITNRALAYSWYEQGEFARSYEMFGNLSEDIDPEILFYRGISAMQIHLDEEAIALFRAYQRNETAKLYRQAKWYESLALLRKGNTAEAEKVWQELAGNKGYKQKEARNLLKQY